MKPAAPRVRMFIWYAVSELNVLSYATKSGNGSGDRRAGSGPGGCLVRASVVGMVGASAGAIGSKEVAGDLDCRGGSAGSACVAARVVSDSGTAHPRRVQLPSGGGHLHSRAVCEPAASVLGAF